MVIELTGKFRDMMKSTYPCITQDELMDKLGEKFGTWFEMDPPKPKYPHDPFRGFIHACCKRVPLEDETAWITVAEFYQKFKNWCQDNEFQKHSEWHENRIAKRFSGLVDRKQMNKNKFKGNFVRGLRFIL
ncbi:hypothetical protein HK102_012993 [Quaeritorhiza haematococci]|nr:hypothetical protein HK102_012993 [Quaeritorhiza haematococci]